MAKVKKRALSTTEKYGNLIGVVVILLLTSIFFLFPKSQFQLIKERLVKKPEDYETHLGLAEVLINNHQFQEAEKELYILGEKTNLKIENLWQRKRYSNPSDISRLINDWEKIITEKPQYRDGYLQLTFLYYQLYQGDKAKEHLQKALEIDPNFQFLREIKKLLED